MWTCLATWVAVEANDLCGRLSCGVAGVAAEQREVGYRLRPSNHQLPRAFPKY